MDSFSILHLKIAGSHHTFSSNKKASAASSGKSVERDQSNNLWIKQI